MAGSDCGHGTTSCPTVTGPPRRDAQRGALEAIFAARIAQCCAVPPVSKDGWIRLHASKCRALPLRASPSSLQCQRIDDAVGPRLTFGCDSK